MTLFLGILLLPALQFTTGGWRGDTAEERRRPAPLPDLADPTRFAERFEAYFDDRFGFRRGLIRFYNAANVEVFYTSPVKRVMVGKEGWFFLNLRTPGVGPDGTLRHYHGVKQFTPAQLSSWRRTLEHQREQMERRGARYLFLVAPDKRTLYPEYLPDHLDFRSPTALDQLWDELSESSVAYIDLRPALRSARELGGVYWRTGTHWTDLGAKVVDDEIVRALRPWFGDVAARPLAAHRITWSEGPGRGLARMLHLQDRYREPHPTLWSQEPTRAVRLDRAAVSRSLAESPGLQASFERLPWVVFETGDAALPRAVIVMDSFGEALTPFLSEHFERSVFLTRILSPAQRLAVIEFERPDLVIDEIVERNLRGYGGAIATAGTPRGARDRSSRPTADRPSRP